MTDRRRRIGLYGGTFDPIHFGHLNLSLEIMERHALDQVLFCPACISPHRLDHASAPTHHRLEMVKRAIAPIPGFEVLDVEIVRGGCSYTIDTVRTLLSQDSSFADAQLFLILSDEAALSMARWREAEEIVSLTPPLVGRRITSSIHPPVTGNERIDAAFREGYSPTPVLEISASQIRERLRAGRYCGHLIPFSVFQYILENKIYI